MISAISKNKKKGVALLFAVLVAGLLMAIGIAIYNVSIWEITLAFSRRESSYAFYAAESGLECALYWNSKKQIPALAPSTLPSSEINLTCARGTAGVSTGEVKLPGIAVLDSDNLMPITLTNGKGKVNNIINAGTGSATTTFYITIDPPSSESPDIPELCAKVSVEKWFTLTAGGGKASHARFISRGFNTDCSLTGARVLEREIKYEY